MQHARGSKQVGGQIARTQSQLQGMTNVEATLCRDFNRSGANDYCEAGSECLTPVARHLLRSGFFLGTISTLKMEVYVPPKRRLTYGLHGVISQRIGTLDYC
jgi:hypothetical protein